MIELIIWKILIPYNIVTIKWIFFKHKDDIDDEDNGDADNIGDGMNDKFGEGDEDKDDAVNDGNGDNDDAGDDGENSSVGGFDDEVLGGKSGDGTDKGDVRWWRWRWWW